MRNKKLFSFGPAAVLALALAAPAAGADLNLSNATALVKPDGSIRLLDYVSGGRHGMADATWNPQTGQWTLDRAVDLSGYHPNYFEIEGNAEPPTAGPSQSVTLWVEATSPFGAGGTAWFDGLTLRRQDGVGRNLVPATAKWPGFDHEGGAMCRTAVNGAYCDVNFSLGREADPGLWSFDPAVHLPNSKRSLKVTLQEPGQHTDAWPLLAPGRGVVCLQNVPGGVALQASAFVKTEGLPQVRVGLDFRQHQNRDCSDPGVPVKTVNGRILRAPREWTELRLR